MFYNIVFKTANRRKEEEFTLYPYNVKGQVTFQSDRSIGVWFVGTNTIKVNDKGSNEKYFMHLAEVETQTITDDTRRKFEIFIKCNYEGTIELNHQSVTIK